MQIIVVFPKLEDAKNIANVLVRNGYDVISSCTTGAQVISQANVLDACIVVSGHMLTDMYYADLYEYLPKGAEMLLLASKAKLDNCYNNNIVCLEMPIKMVALIETLNMMLYRYERKIKKQKQKQKTQRKEEDKQKINKAKEFLMDRNHMSEEEAHYYLQKTSMDAGTSMVEVAEMILCMHDLM